MQSKPGANCKRQALLCGKSLVMKILSTLARPEHVIGYPRD
jgi:hypothetical protein